MTQIISIIDSYTYPRTVGDLVVQRLIVPMLGGTADESIIEAALPEVDKSMRELERILGDQEFLTGNSLSLADLCLAPILCVFRQYAGKQGHSGGQSQPQRLVATHGIPGQHD